jgi:hypothetical protein
MHILHLYGILLRKTRILVRMKDKGQSKRDGGKRGRETEDQNTATEKGTLGQWIGVKGLRKEDGRQGTDHVRQGTNDGRQGTETWDRGRETRNREVRVGTADGRQGRET